MPSNDGYCYWRISSFLPKVIQLVYSRASSQFYYMLVFKPQSTFPKLFFFSSEKCECYHTNATSLKGVSWSLERVLSLKSEFLGLALHHKWLGGPWTIHCFSLFVSFLIYNIKELNQINSRFCLFHLWPSIAPD